MGRKYDSILEESKAYISNFYVNGEFLDTPIEIKFNGRIVEQGTMDYLRRLFDFLINGNMINNASVIWLTSNLSTVKEAIENYNSQQLEIDRVNINTALANIQNDKKRLLPYFPPKFIFTLLAYPEKYLEKANDTLDMLLRKYMKDREYSQSLVIKLNKNDINRELDEYNWIKLKTLLETYSKIKIKNIESGEDEDVTSDMIGYYNYLISSNRLNKLDKLRLMELRQILSLGD